MKGITSKNDSIQPEYSPEMRIFDHAGNRLYLNESERERFLDAAKDEDGDLQVFCHLLHYTGCRPSEALELSPSRINLADKLIIFRTLKKRKLDYLGRKKQPEFRSVPVPARLIEDMNLAFSLRTLINDKKLAQMPLWSMSRMTAYRLAKRVMQRAGIEGPQATSKGLRHSFGVSCVMAGVPLHKVAQWLGHSDVKTTEIYTQVVNEEDREMLMRVWE